MLVAERIAVDHGRTMEWQIKTMADCSARTGTHFNPGERVACLIHMDGEAGELCRSDLLESEVEGFALPGPLLGRWSRQVEEPDADSGSAPATLQSAEDFFLSLFSDGPEGEEPPPEKQALQHLLALLLERKRVLRAVGPRRIDGEQPYLHVKSKRTFDVPVVTVSASLMEGIEDAIGELIF